MADDNVHNGEGEPAEGQEPELDDFGALTGGDADESGSLPPLSELDSSVSSGFESESGLPPLGSLDFESGGMDSSGGLPPIEDLSVEEPTPAGGNIKPPPTRIREPLERTRRLLRWFLTRRPVFLARLKPTVPDSRTSAPTATSPNPVPESARDLTPILKPPCSTAPSAPTIPWAEHRPPHNMLKRLCSAAPRPTRPPGALPPIRPLSTWTPPPKCAVPAAAKNPSLSTTGAFDLGGDSGGDAFEGGGTPMPDFSPDTGMPAEEAPHGRHARR